MLSLIRTLPIATVLLASSAAAWGKDIPGAQSLPTGIFAESAELCRSYWRTGPNLEIGLSKIKGKYYYHDCHSSRNCTYQVVGHTRRPDGFVLRLKYTFWTGEPTRKLTIRRIDNDRFVFAKEGEAPTTRIRCTEADIVAGIGLQTPDDEEDGYDPEFSVYYALEIPGLCPGLAIDSDAALDRIPAHFTEKAKRIRELDVKFDKNNIKDFCRKVLDAFGPNGRVIPDLLYPAGSKR